MKSIKHEIRYDGATLAQVWAMLQDRRFREQVCDDQGVVRRDVTITPAGDGMSAKITYVHGASGIPSFAQKFVGDEIPIVQNEEWSSPTDASLEVLIPGKPGSMSGTIHVEERDGGVSEQVAMDVKVSIPLVGGRIEGLVGGMLLKALKAENKVGRQWLAGNL